MSKIKTLGEEVGIEVLTITPTTLYLEINKVKSLISIQEVTDFIVNFSKEKIEK